MTCIDLTTSNGPQIIDSRRVLYRDGGRVYANEIPDGCPFLHGDVEIVAHSHRQFPQRRGVDPFFQPR